MGVPLEHSNVVPAQLPDVHLIHDDALNGLSQVSDGTTSPIVTSPPYNIGKDYERDQKMSLDQYIEGLTPIPPFIAVARPGLSNELKI